MAVEILVEGITDEIFVRRCYELLGIEVSTVYGKRGSSYIKNKARGFAVRGEFSPILILTDHMDVPGECPPASRFLLVPNDYEHTLVRLAVNEVEAWIIASSRELASFFGVSVAHIPAVPDEISDPKQALINLARRSPRHRIKKMFVPKEGVSATVGEGYVEGFEEFVRFHWSMDSAEANSPSFSSFIRRSREKFLVVQQPAAEVV